MSKLVQLPGSTQSVREQAAAWLVCLEEGLSAEERARLQEWLESDPAHGVALIRMAKHWDAFSTLSELAEIFPLHTRARRRAGQLVLRAACIGIALVALVGAGFYAVGHREQLASLVAMSSLAGDHDGAGREPSPNSMAGVTRQLHTAVGQQMSEQMPDGSVITLNTDTLVDVVYSATERLVVLNRGEALFNVAHDPERPFRVRAGDRFVQAVGTTFNVRRGSGNHVRVTVSEGTVKVMREPNATRGHATEEVTVRAGEQAVVADAVAEVHPLEAVQLEANLAWQRGLLIYQGEPLDSVLADIARYTTVRFSIADESIRRTRVGGVFRAGDVDGLLLALRESFNIEPRREGDVIVLTAKR